MRVILLSVLIAACVAQTTYQTFYTFNGGSCNSNQVVFQRSTPAACTPGQGACTPTASGSTRTTCQQGVPNTIASGVAMSVYAASQNTCGGDSLATISWASGLCVQDGASSYTVSCTVGSQLFVAYWPSNNLCFGPSNVYTYNTGCNPPGVQGLPGNLTGNFVSVTCNGVCFHESSKIQLPETKKVVTLDELLRKEHPECHVPHQVQGGGVAISSTCSADKLRLTADHLVYTNRGLIAATNVRVGDEVFGDQAESKKCQVTKVESEQNQRYFALNCHESEVITNGVKTSTFGVVHRVPALWMKYASKVIGIERASKIGDVVASVLARLSLI